MSSNNKDNDKKGINRRNFVKLGASGMAVAAIPGISNAYGALKASKTEDLKSNSRSGIRTAIITDIFL